MDFYVWEHCVLSWNGALNILFESVQFWVNCPFNILRHLHFPWLCYNCLVLLCTYCPTNTEPDVPPNVCEKDLFCDADEASVLEVGVPARLYL